MPPLPVSPSGSSRRVGAGLSRHDALTIVCLIGWSSWPRRKAYPPGAGYAVIMMLAILDMENDDAEVDESRDHLSGGADDELSRQ